MVSHEEIAKLAHELYEKSGRVPGRDLENWHEAERMLRKRYGNGGKTNGGNGEETIAAEKASSRKRTTAREGVKKSEPKKTTARKTTKKKAEAE
jgi:hypothetical protein